MKQVLSLERLAASDCQCPRAPGHPFGIHVPARSRRRPCCWLQTHWWGRPPETEGWIRYDSLEGNFETTSPKPCDDKKRDSEIQSKED